MLSSVNSTRYSECCHCPTEQMSMGLTEYLHFLRQEQPCASLFQLAVLSTITVYSE